MKQSISWKKILLAGMIAIIGYIMVLSTNKKGLVDMGIETILFFTGSFIGFKGYLKSKKGMDKNFKRFQLFYGLTYLIVVISFIMGICYQIYYWYIIEITLEHVKGNYWLITMSAIKSLSMVFLILAWSFFYRYLNIKEAMVKKLFLYVSGTLLYFAASMIIWKLTKDISVLSLGIVVGSVVGIFALISLDKRTRGLTIIFIIYSTIHLIDFYIMGIGRSLTTGITNPIYWGVTVLYVLEVKSWIDMELIV